MCGPQRYLLQLELIPHPASVSLARSVVGQVLASWCSPETVDDARTVVSELVTNAVQVTSGLPGGNPRDRVLGLAVDRAERAVRIQVTDPATDRPLPREGKPSDPGPAATRGRGLGLVAALTARWGWGVHPDHKFVWAELPATST